MDILFDCSSGVSGDMIVGALLDLGADANKLKETIKSLNLTKYAISIKKTEKMAFFALILMFFWKITILIMIWTIFLGRKELT